MLDAAEGLPSAGQLIRKDSIEELCGHRARALELYAQGYALLAEAYQTSTRACIGNSSVYPLDHELFRSPNPESLPDFAAKARTHIDRAMWRALIVNTPIGSLMDKAERDKLEAALQAEPPEATADNIFATMSRLFGEADVIFRRGLVNAFSRLNRDYKSHDGFKIGDRIVLSYIVQCDDWADHFNYRSEDVLRDVDRVFHILDGKAAPDYQQGLCAAMRTQMQTRRNSDTRNDNPDYKREVETPYFRVRWFKNGNAHMWFLRDDLVMKANRLIAEHFGEVLGAAPNVAERGYTPPPATPDGAKEDFFATPASVAEAVVARAQIKPGERVLEPSAGEGALCRAAIASGAKVDAIERNVRRVKFLQSALFIRAPQHVIWGDFLIAAPTGAYDAVIMNPPWSGDQWAAHVLHAFGFLKPGGRLVAIVPRSVRSSGTRAAETVRNLLVKCGASIADLPDGSFKESGTEARGCVIVARKPF